MWLEDTGRSVLKLTGHMDRKEGDRAGSRAHAPSGDQNNTTIMMTHNVVKKWRVLAGLRGEWRRRVKGREVWRQAMEMTT